MEYYSPVQDQVGSKEYNKNYKVLANLAQTDNIF